MSKVADLKQLFEQLFNKRMDLLTLWQEQADNFYPQRADFTTKRNLGTDFASQLMTSYPVIARRDMGNALSTMLRTTNQDWFKLKTNIQDFEDQAGLEWLDRATEIQRKAMYARNSQFNRAVNEGDHDFAAFGQCVISIEPNYNLNSLLYRCWHLRDVAWCESYDGTIGTIARKWRPTARQLYSIFGNKVSDKVLRMLDKEPMTEVECAHIVMKGDEYPNNEIATLGS